MDFMKFGAGAAQTQMQAEHDPNASFPWWVRWLAKALGIIGGGIAIFFAILGLLSLSASCIAANLLQLVAGFLSIALEAPFCCAFIDFIERIAAFSESRAYWQKAALFCGMGAVPILICPELNTILGAGSIFACGVVYGFMALGKKADRGTMMGTAGGDNAAWSPQVNQGGPTPPTGFNQP
ncbi:TVP18/Calcium channel flower [Aphelenchoides avenae]|nr:TVP18/Calcium channel flower [Aphelenchus avenae]KAH7704821.1 TVP18/Calcium channel flower [Aphelenchus avenae]